MGLKFIIKLALKNLRFRFLRTVLTLSGIIISISAVVFLAAFTFGLQDIVTVAIGGGQNFSYLDAATGNSRVVKINNQTVEKISAVSGVKSVQESASFPAKAKVGLGSSDISFYATTSQYLEWQGARTITGSLISSAEPGKIVVNESFLEILDVSAPESLGRKMKFEFILPKELTGEEQEKIVEDQEFEIAGVLKDESAPKVYANIEALEGAGLKNYSQIKVELESKEKVAAVRRAIENMGLETSYIGDTVAEVESVFGIFRLILVSFGFLALVVAVLGTFNTLTISLMERIKEVALFRVLGISQKDLRRIFLVEASIFGILGGILGILCGVLLGTIANAIVNHYAVTSGAETAKLFSYPIVFIILIFFISSIVSFLTGLYPAQKAAKVDTLDVLRYE